MIKPDAGHGSEPRFLSKLASSALSASEVTSTLVDLGLTDGFTVLTAILLSGVLSLASGLFLFNSANLAFSFFAASFLAISISLLIIAVIIFFNFASCFLFAVTWAVSSFCWLL